MKFIKIFTNEIEATRFAEAKGARVVVRYDWDSLFERMVREFVVEY